MHTQIEQSDGQDLPTDLNVVDSSNEKDGEIYGIMEIGNNEYFYLVNNEKVNEDEER